MRRKAHYGQALDELRRYARSSPVKWCTASLVLRSESGCDGWFASVNRTSASAEVGDD